MTLTHTTHAGYIRQDDVYTDENGVNYTVCQDIDAGDPRTWLSHEEAALIVINADRNTRIDDINDYDDNPVINNLLQAMGEHDIDDPSDILTEWLEAWIHNAKLDQPSYDIKMMTIHTSQSTWFTIIAAVKEDYGSARDNIDTFVTWARGDVWVVSPDHPDYGTLCGIYADDAEAAVKHYIENYVPKAEPPQAETLF